MMKANIWDSSADHQSHRYEPDSCCSAVQNYSFLLVQFHLFCVNVRGYMHLHGRLPKLLVIFFFVSQQEQGQVSLRVDSCEPFTPTYCPKCRGSLSGSPCTSKVGIKRKGESCTPGDGKREQFLLASALPRSPAGLTV